MKKTLFTIIAFFVAAASAFAQTVRVEVPKVVAADEQFTIRFVVEGDKPSDFNWNCPSDFQLVWGPQRGSSSQTSIVNGKVTKTVESSFSYILLPKKEGDFTLPAAIATIKGKKVESSAVSIKVAKNGAASSANPTVSNGFAVSGEDLFLRMDLSRRKVVVGEPITATIKLYQRVDIAGFDDVKFPSFDGFWNQVTQSPTNVVFQREKLGDEIYNVALLRSYTLIPQQSGVLTIDPAEIVCLIRVKAQRSSSNSIFDSFFQDDYTTIRKRVATREEEITVNPLPQPQPESFCGGVGNYSIKAVVAKDSLQTHDASSVVVTVSGSGNLALVTAPKVYFPPDFEVYDVKVTDKDGQKVFEYPFIPRHYGNFEIPPVEFSYFDAKQYSYVSVQSDTLRVKVSRPEGAEITQNNASQSFVGVAGREVRTIGEDIRYITSKATGLQRAGAFFVASPLFILIVLVLILGSVLIYIVENRRAALRLDVAGQKRKVASKVARKRLSRAGEYLKGDLYGAFYEELHKALLGFVSDRLSMDISDQSHDVIAQRMGENGAGTEDIDSFMALLDACEFARYAPSDDHKQMDEHYKAALVLISSLDSSLRRRKSGAAGAAAAIALALFMAPVDASAYDAQLDSLWTAGADAYAAGVWDEAQYQWESIVEAGYESAQLYCNLGSACWRRADLAHAVIYYERALKLDPSCKDAQYNLDYVRTFLKDRIDEVPQFFAVRWVKSIRSLVSGNVWAVIFLVLFAIFLMGALLWKLSQTRSIRIASFFGGIVALLLALFALSMSLSDRRDYYSDTEAVVVSPVCVARSVPDQHSGTDRFILHEGTKVKVLDTVGKWKNVELPNGTQGWIPTEEIENI